MEATLTTPRVKSYVVPHKTLRNILSQLSMMTGNTDFSNREEVERLKAFSRTVFSMMDHHAHIENTVILAELDERCPGASEHDMADHEELEHHQKAIEAMYEAAGSTADPEFGHRLYLEFSNFHGLYLEHIFHEETETEALLHQHFTDEELNGHRDRIMGTMPPDQLMLWLKHGVPAFSHPERVGLLGGFKAKAPQPVFEAAMGVIRQEMTPRDYDRMMAALN